MVNITLKQDLQKHALYALEDLPILPEPSPLRVTLHSHAWRPPTDVYETVEEYVVRVEIAGMHDTDFSIVLDSRTLSIRGIRSDTPERRAYHQMEIRYGEFGCDVELPGPVSGKEIEAIYGNGFLQIRLPKAHPVKVHIEE